MVDLQRSGILASLYQPFPGIMVEVLFLGPEEFLHSGEIFSSTPFSRLFLWFSILKS